MNLQSAVNNIASRFNGWVQKKQADQSLKDQRVRDLVTKVSGGFQSFLAHPQRLIEEKQRQLNSLNLQSKFNQARINPFKQIDASGVAKGFQDYLQKTGNKRTMGAGPLGYAAGLTNSQLLNGIADVTYRPITRAGFEGAQSLSGDKNTYKPQPGIQQALLGSSELRNFGDPNRTARKLAHGVGADWLGTPLVGLGVAADVAVPGVDDAAKVGAKKATGVLVEKLGKEGAMSWLLKYQDVLTKLGVKEQMSASQALDYVEKNVPGALRDTGIVSNSILDAFKTWVNNRRASELTAVARKVPFQELDKKGVQGFIDFQAGEKTGLFQKVKNYFDTAYDRAVKSGLDVRFKEAYLPQLWKNPDEAQKIFKSLGQKPSFTIESVLKDYKTGLDYGLQPKFQKVSDLIGWYEFKLNRSTADRQFFTLLDSTGWIKPTEGRIPSGWSQITAEGFPKLKSKEGDINYIAPQKLADAINNYLSDPTGAVSSFAKFVTGAKNVGLAAGLAIPYPTIKEGKLGLGWIKTAANAHGVNLWARSWIAAKNPLSQMLKSTEWLVNPNAAEKFVQSHYDEAAKFVKAGMTMTTEDVAFTREAKAIEGSLIQKGYKYAGNFFDEVFSKPLFNKMVPALKVNYAQQVYNDVVQDLGQEMARKHAAETANNIFGGINLNELMRDKNSQNVLRSLLLAPDWLETHFQIGKGIVNSLRENTPQGRAYRIIARNVAGYYVAANVLNKAMSGHWMFENEGVSNKFFIDTGSFNSRGEKRYFRPAGTSVDFIRLPVEIALGMVSGDLGSAGRAIANRLSLPVGSILHLLSNKNFLNQQIYGNKYGEPMPLDQQIGGIASEVMQGIGVPSQIGAVTDFATGKSGIEETGMRLTELPVRYADKATSKKEIQNRESLMATGMRGQQLHDLMNQDQEYKSGVVGWFNGLFGKKVSEDRSNSPLLKALDDEAALDEKSKRIKEIFKIGLDEAGIKKMLEHEGLGDYETASMTVIKSLPVESGARGIVIKSLLKGLSEDEFIKSALVLAENEVLTTGVIAKFVDDGDLTENQADALRDLIKVTKGTFKAKSGLKILKPPTLDFSAPSLQSIRIKPSSVNIRPQALPQLPEMRSQARPSLAAPEIKAGVLPARPMPQTLEGLGRI